MSIVYDYNAIGKRLEELNHGRKDALLKALAEKAKQHSGERNTGFEREVAIILDCNWIGRTQGGQFVGCKKNLGWECALEGRCWFHS